ncbi:hypothetical protein C8Q80DRAFT_1266947 [Daedaleopsis nitida]|nr:hypothetical protein C8Q80DRAFT_1266947 [Daedaleopsis nitida]
MFSISSILKDVFTRLTRSAKSKRSSQDPEEQHNLAATVVRCYPHPSIHVRVQHETRVVSTHRLAQASTYIAYHILWNLNKAVGRSRPPVYDLPAAVSADGFSEMLDASDDMAAYLEAPHSEDRLFELLITSHALSSVPVLNNLDALLDRMWGHSGLPWRPRPLDQVRTLVRMAREHNFHNRRDSGQWVMTHALYELLSSAELHIPWELGQEDKIEDLDLAAEDIKVLEHARGPMRALWREHLLRAPGTKTSLLGEEHSQCVSLSRGSETRLRGVCAAGQSSEDRIDWWRTDLRAEGVLVREADVLRYNYVARRGHDLEIGWCDGCLREWEEHWERARVGWWREFHALVQEALSIQSSDCRG